MHLPGLLLACVKLQPTASISATYCSGYDALLGAKLLQDSDCTPLLPTVIANHFLLLRTLNRAVRTHAVATAAGAAAAISIPGDCWQSGATAAVYAWSLPRLCCYDTQHCTP